MELLNFSNKYILIEYQRLKCMLDSMPRYKVGTHKGRHVIRDYKGYGNERVKRIAYENGGTYSEMNEQLLKYKELTRLKDLYFEELKRRNSDIPIKTDFKRDTSVFDIKLWNSLIPCSNTHEIKTVYFDDYGFHVRSRVEMLIGNSLKALGLEAKYEPALILKDGRRVTPVYVFPIYPIDRCFFIEFIGMTGNDNYINYNYGKFDEYMRNGVLPERDLILLCGSDTWIPSQESIKYTIASFINNAVARIDNHKS